jgi:osmotically-inducible protein OsmY
MTTSHAARQMLATIFGAAGVAFAVSAGAVTSSDRSADEQINLDRQTTVQEPRTSDRIADPVQSNTESGQAQDRLVAERVQAALNEDAELKQARLRVQADNGRVRLVGSVNSFEKKDRAIEIASAVQGVSGVDDGITLRERPQPTARR